MEKLLSHFFAENLFGEYNEVSYINIVLILFLSLGKGWGTVSQHRRTQPKILRAFTFAIPPQNKTTNILGYDRVLV
jgi:hypothetical protein